MHISLYRAFQISSFLDFHPQHKYLFLRYFRALQFSCLWQDPKAIRSHQRRERGQQSRQKRHVRRPQRLLFLRQDLLPRKQAPRMMASTRRSPSKRYQDHHLRFIKAEVHLRQGQQHTPTQRQKPMSKPGNQFQRVVLLTILCHQNLRGRAPWL